MCDFLFNPERAARIVEFHARHGVEFPMLDDVFEKILDETFRATAQSGYEGEIQRTVNAVVLNELMTLAANERASNQVRAIAELKLEELRDLGRKSVRRRHAIKINARFCFTPRIRSSAFRTIRKR